MVTHSSALVADDTMLGDDASIGPFCVVGLDGDGEPTHFGPRALLRSHVVVYRGTTAGARLHAAHHVLIREETTIGDNVSIGSHSVVEHHVRIGNGVRLHSRCFVPELSVLEDGAWLGPGVVLTNARYPNRADTKANLVGVTVERGAALGAGVVVLPGLVIGAGSLIGAGAVVTQDVPPGATVVGNPAKVIS